ncbi:MAG: hypothetical protein ACFFCT_00010 [Candidatus Odinarchaeota archaeon]
MRHRFVISIVLIVIFIFPVLSNNDTIMPSNDGFSGYPDMNTRYTTSADSYHGTGPALPVSLSGIATDRYGGSLQIDSSTAGIRTITLDEGWTGSNLQTTIDSLSVEISDALINPSWNAYHPEKWLIGTTSYYQEDVYVPDGWTLVKNEMHESAHPHTGDWENNFVSTGGYGDSPRYRFDAVIDSTSAVSDELYFSQLVNAPWREIYSAEISFRYYVIPGYNTSSAMNLFFRFAGIERTYTVFEAGDPTGVWLQTTATLSAADLASIMLPDALLLDVGMGTDLTGASPQIQFRAYIDEIGLIMNVRPFPEQIDLKVDGTAVIGATQASIYPYLPDDSNRDAEDNAANGIDLDGWSWGSGSPGVLYVGVWGAATDWTDASAFQNGFQFPLSIPQGAAITSAYLEVEPSSETGITSTRIYAAGNNSSGLPIENFTIGLPHLEDRFNWVDTSIDWKVTDWLGPVRIRQRSPDISSLIQAIVSDNNWNSNQYACLMLDYMWSNTYQAEWGVKGSMGTNNYAQDELARLFVEYMIPLPEDTVYFMQHEKDITIDHNQVSGTLTNFPVLIDITDTDLKTDVRADGDDIIFKLGDEALDFEIELFDQDYSPTHARLVAWVMIPTLSSTQDTVITMAYGNPNAGPSSSTNVWEEYETVHHLADDPSGTVHDSTANNYEGTSFGGMTIDDLVTGIAGNGINFDYDSVTVPNSDMINIGQIYTDDWSSFTVSLWVYMDVDKDCRVFSKSPTTTTSQHIMTTRIASRTLTARLRTDTTGGSYNANTSFALGSWQYIVWSWQTSGGAILGYMNGVPILSAANAGNNLYDSNDVFVIANNNMANDATNSRFFDGILDEIRLTRSLRSVAWIQTEYSNQVNPSSFASVSSSERTIQSTWSGAESTTVRFSTTSGAPVDIFPIVTMDISGGGQTLDESMQEGTSFYVANATIVEWTANVLVSPPADAESLNIQVEYPLTEWKPISVTNPIGQVKMFGTDWTFHDGAVVIFSDAVDIWGVWTIEFVSWNYVYNLKLGPSGQANYDTYTFNVDDTAEFKISSPWIENARAGLVLTDPNDNVWYSTYTTTGTPGTTWDVPSFGYRMQLTIPAAQVDAAVTNFPLMFSHADTDFQTKVQADGDDFVFVQNNKVLAHEIDRFEQSTGRLVAWVRANLSNTVDNTIWLYYGNPVIGSTESPETLWSNGYEAVWLLNEDVTNEGSGGLHIDSTGNGYTGTQYGNSRDIGNMNGYGQSFDGNDYIAINSTEGLRPAGDVTISGWFYIDSAWSSTSSPSRVLVSKYLDGDNNFHIALVGSDYTESGVPAGSLVFGFENNNVEWVKWTTQTSWNSGWHHFACYLDADTPSNNKIYADGIDRTDAASVGTASARNLAFDADWGIGGRYVETSEFPTGEAFHTGRIDELRIATVQRAASWFAVEYDNQYAFQASFIVEGAEQTRTSPEHTISKLIDSTAPAGLWTVSAYYNDTGTTVSYGTGLFERNFLVKHDSSLSLIYPTDAVSDKTAYKVAGEILYVEVELTDDINANKISNAEVKMNWSVSGTPTELTLNNIGNGRYGKSVDTSDLDDEGQYRIIIYSYHQFYNNATDYFDLELYHATELDFTDVDSTPVGFDFTATLIFEDVYDGTPIAGATITFDNGTAVNVIAQANGRYNISLSTGGLGYGDHVYVFKAAKAGSYLEDGSVTVTFTLRKHFTSVSVIGDLVTPYGEATPVTVVIVDMDTGLALTSTSSVNSWSFTSGYAPIDEISPSDFLVILPTNTWVVDTESVTLSVSMSGIYFSPSEYQFDVEIRRHYTSVSVVGDLISPYGTSTSLTIVIIDTDTGATLSASDVSSFLLNPASYSDHSESSPVDLIVNLDTSSWAVGTDTVTLSVVMAGNYDNPINYQFSIQIRKHYTSVTVIGDLVSPYGQTTALTLVITDLDTGLTLTSVSVTSFTFTPSSYGSQGDSSPTDLDFILDTSTWSVSTETVTLSVVMSGNYYNPADYVFYVDIRKHYTSVTVTGDLLTPHGYTTQLTIIIRDTDTGTILTASDVSSFLLNPASYSDHSESSPADLIVDLDTSSWAVGTDTVTLSVVMGGNYNNPTNYQFDIQIRNHYTSVTVFGNLTTAYGKPTTLTIAIRDSDTGTFLTASDVSGFILNPASYTDTQETNPSDLIVVLDTSNWIVGTETVTLSVVMTGNFYNPSNHVFDIQIRKHLTSITVVGNLVSPYSNVTPLTIMITDLDTGTLLTASVVQSFTFTSSYAPYTENDPIADLLVNLPTGAWAVGSHAVTLQLTMKGSSNYFSPSNYGFSITIRSVTTYIVNEPGDLRYPTGSDFMIVVTVNVSEQGSMFGDPVTGLLQGEFAVRNATQIIPIKEFHDLTNGRYNLTIDASYFPEGVYTIFITITPSNNIYAKSQMTLIFEYTPARSELSSPDRAAVTPYDTDFVVTLTFLDIDRSQGINGATITAFGITIYNQQDLGNGVYKVTVDVSGLAKGEHLYNLTADKVGYEAQTISFKVVIRIAFAYAIPSVGALDIPVGDDPVFFVEYWDIDHDVPITDGAPFLATSTWIHSVTITYIPSEQRYRVTFITNDDDQLRQNYIVSFNFSKGENYQFGLFNISVTIRTHNTDFRLVSAIEPVSYTSNITISLFFGDIDSGEGIASQYVSHRVWNGTVNVISYLYNVTGQPGYYTIIVPAQQFGGIGIQNFTIYFNWTGPVSTYKNSYLITAASIVGEGSQLTLLVTAEPTPYLENMTYTLFYAATNGTGISNITGYVFISIEFEGETVDLNQVQIWEINPVTDRGKYSIRFNTSLLAKTGLIYMKVYINWAKGIEPFYNNRTDTISVRILPRDTLVSISPPIQTAYNVNATFSFTYDDVTGESNVPIANDAKLTISTSLSDYSISYNGITKTFTISFDTSQFGALGVQSFTLDVRWDGAPFYANQTGRSITIRVIARQTVLDYQTPSPTQYLDNVTFTVTWTDVVQTATGIEGATITLYDGVSLISTTYYTVYEIGSGVYSIVLNSTYKANPGTYIIKVNIASTDFYYISREDTRSFIIRYRSTLTSSEPVTTVPYSSSFTAILYYQDILTLDIIGNDSSLVTFEILNGSSWIYTIEWKSSLGYYELIVETSNQPTLSVGSIYFLHINMSYSSTSPFYKSDDAYITFEIRTRASALEKQESPIPTPYLDNVTFTVYFSDVDDSSPITSANIYVFNGVTPLVYGTGYFYSHLGGGVFQVIVQTIVLNGLGVTTVNVQAEWTGGAPFHDNSDVDVDLTVIRRTTNVEIVTPPSQTYYMENITFTVSFIDIATGVELQATKDLISIYNDVVLLAASEFSMTQIGAGYTYEISINSTVLSTVLVKNRIITVFIDWPDSPNYYKDDSTSTSATTIERRTYVSINRPGNTPYGENATFTFTFIDSTSLPEVLVGYSGEMFITTNLTENPSLSYEVATHIFTMSFNTDQFGNVGLAAFYINVTWAGLPYYANKTMQLVYVTITMRQTQIDFEAPAPTPYGDIVTFDILYLDISGTTDVGIPDATLTLYYLGAPIPGGNYVVTPNGFGNFEVAFDTGFFSQPGYYNLNVTFVYTGGYFREDASAVRTLNVRYRTTILSANPVGQIGYETQIEVTLLFQDILTLADIDDTFTSFAILNNTGTPWVYSITWQPATSSYLLVITTVGQTTLTLGDHSLWLNMSYANVDPFYRWDDVYIELTIRTRTSALDLQEAAIPAPFLENASFVVYYWDADVTEGISGANFILEVSSVLTPNVDYFVVNGLPGVYTIYVDSTALGSLGTYSIRVTAVWPGGAPYHNNAQRNVSVSTTNRPAAVDIIEPPNQPRYLDNLTFTFAYIDSINGSQVPGINSSEISIYANGTLLNPGDYMLTPVGSTFIVAINSTILSANLVKDFSLTVFVDWIGGLSPFYTDDSASMKVSTTQRIILVEPQQIETTPVHDNMTVSFILIDEDNENPVSGAIILFRCVSPFRPLSEGVEYTLTEGTGINAGVYTISIDSHFLVWGPTDLGTFIFELEVQWNQNDQPFYKNKLPITLRGAVDLIWANMQAGIPTPSEVQITGNVSILITLTDLDHNQGISLLTSVIEVHYYGTTIIPAPMDITYLGSGDYLIEFSTIDLNNFGSHSVNISISYYPYTSMIVNPSFTVTEIITSLLPLETQMTLNWTELAYIEVEYNNELYSNQTSGASLNWTYGTASGIFTEISDTGIYYAYVNTSLKNSGTGVVTIRADKDKYRLSVTTVTLIVLALPSELVISSPSLSFTNYRGDPVDVEIYIIDVYNGGIRIVSGITSVYMIFESIRYDLIMNATGHWLGTLPFNATAALEPGRIYSARVFADAINYNPASSVFKMDLLATKTTIYLVTPTSDRMDAVYKKNVTFYLSFNQTQTGEFIENATISWIDSAFGIYENFTYNSTSGLWELKFDTSRLSFGTWGITFEGIPGDYNLAADRIDLVITIRKIRTEVILEYPGVIYWGWVGNLRFYYHDIDFDIGINNATAEFQWGPIKGNATDLGDGWYSFLINTTLLDTGIRYSVIIDFDKYNYQVSTGILSLLVEDVPTELDLSTPTENQVDNHSDNLVIPFGDSIPISLFYNDTDNSEGYVGGLSGATITATIFGGGVVTSLTFDVIDLGNGTYYFVFDSTAIELFELQQFIPQALPLNPFTIRIEVELAYREGFTEQNAITILVTIIERPTTLEFYSTNVQDGSISMFYGQEIEILVFYHESWLGIQGAGITNAVFTASSERALVQIISNTSTTQPGVYLLTIRVDAPLVPVGIDDQNVDLTISINLDNYEQKELDLTVLIHPTEQQRTMGTIISLATPSLFLVFLLAVLWTRYFSIPKRLRQINSQIKALKRGKIPKPISDTKSRQELIAELFNDTYQKLAITRAASDMPEASIPIEVPEIRELLIQLSILTHLSPDEFDEFNADISKMKMSEQAAFVKEVIMQEALRAARARGKTVEEILEEVATQASSRLSTSEEVETITPSPDETAREPTLLIEDEVEFEEPEPTAEIPSVEDEGPTEKLSQFELEELKAELVKRGVPNHEIHMIMEQARNLSRELVEELIKSLGLKD